MPTTLAEFEAVWPQLAKDLTEICNQSNLPEQPLKWFQDVNDTFNQLQWHD